HSSGFRAVAHRGALGGGESGTTGGVRDFANVPDVGGPQVPTAPRGFWRTPRGSASASSAPGRPWHTRYPALLHLPGTDGPLGTEAEPACPLRGSRVPPGRMRRRAGPAINGVDSRDPPLLRRHIV